jgi:hypothetical protein
MSGGLNEYLMNYFNQQILNNAAKYSLAFLWIFTGLTSLYLSPEIGYKILVNANITDSLATIMVYAGGILDIMLGLWLITSADFSRQCDTLNFNGQWAKLTVD